MSFVPVVTPPPPPSPQARELARRISELIEQFRMEQPSTNAVDVQRALQLAATPSGAVQGLRMKLILVAILILGILVFVYLMQA